MERIIKQKRLVCCLDLKLYKWAAVCKKTLNTINTARLDIIFDIFHSPPVCDHNTRTDVALGKG